MSKQQPNGKPANPPNQTLYVTNLPDKLPKDDLRRSLYGIFATYGPVLDVVALKTMKMRGQAHIVFRDVQASSQAMRSLQGFDFFGKEMRIAYARGKSNIISRLDGSVKSLDGKQAAPTVVIASEQQRSLFNNPNAPELNKPVPLATATNSLAAPLSEGRADGSRSPQGVKRGRDEESDNDDVSMEEEDDDEGDAMEESDED